MLNKVSLPDGDLLIHSGDATSVGQIIDIVKFNQELGGIKTKYKHGIIFIPGNHDFLFERNQQLARDIMTNAKVLIDESVEIEGIKIYGSPWQPEFNNWAFNLPRGEALKQRWSTIPDDTNILVTHGPPYGILDKCPDGSLVGCEELYKRVFELKQLKLHQFGHIHHAWGTKQIDNITFINASICTENYKPTNKPWIINI